MIPLDSAGDPMIPGGPVSSLSSGHDGTCIEGRKHSSFLELHQCSIRGSAANHAGTKHIGKRFMCPRCPCTYASKSGLNEHVRHIHEHASRYRCDTCGKGFSIRSIYYDHLAAHTGVKRYVCSVCLKEFTRKSSMKAHMLLSHHAEIAPE